MIMCCGASEKMLCFRSEGYICFDFPNVEKLKDKMEIDVVQQVTEFDPNS